MSTTAWIILVVAVLVVAALVAWMATQQRKKKHVEHPEHLREEAREQATAIPEDQVRAREAEVKAERARLEAERAQQKAHDAQVAATQQQAVHEDRLRTADQVDPRVDTSSSTSAGRHDPDTVLDADDPRRTDGTDGTHRA